MAEKPKILVLDEAANSLDVDTEYQVLKHIDDVYEDITKIIITHNEKYLSNVDYVLYLKDGEVEGFGAHDELLTNNRCYFGCCCFSVICQRTYFISNNSKASPKFSCTSSFNSCV